MEGDLPVGGAFMRSIVRFDLVIELEGISMHKWMVDI